MLRKYIATLLLFVCLQGIGFTDEFVDLSNHKTQMEYTYFSPVQLEGSKDLYIYSGINHSLFNYEAKNKYGTCYYLQVEQSQQNYEISDSSNTSLAIGNRDKYGLQIGLKQDIKGNVFSLNFGFSESVGISQLNFGYTYHQNQFDIFTDLRLTQAAWAVTVKNNDYSILGTAFYKKSVLRIGNNLHSKWGSLSASIAGSIPLTIPGHIEGISTEMSPFYREYDLNLISQIHNEGHLEIFLNLKTDTLNSDIRSDEKNVGKLYAFDKAEQSLGVKLRRGHYSASLQYHTFDTRVSGSVLATYFGDVLTQLSGARYFHQVEINGSYTELTFATKGKVGRILDYQIENSLFTGNGEIYSKHYVFQLFNPITDLRIQELKVHSFIVDKISLEMRRGILSNIVLVVDIDYLFPLQVDMKISPERDYDSADLSLGTKFGARLIYRFD